MIIILINPFYRNQQKNRIFVLGNPDLKNLQCLIDKTNINYLSDIIDIPSKNNDYTFIFARKDSNSDIFKRCEKYNFENLVILCFYKDKSREQLIEYFITQFYEKKYDTNIFPFFIILKEEYEEFIENKYENILQKYKDKIDVNKCKNKIIVALRKNSLESYIPKIIQIFNGYSNLLICEKDKQKITELSQYNQIKINLKRETQFF